MARWLFFCVLLIGVLLGRLPQPCLGNGAGQSCSAESCACVAACSCQTAHAQALQERYGACGDAAALACHREELPHVFLPDPPEKALLPRLDAGLTHEVGRRPAMPWLAHVPLAVRALPQRPPWSLGA